MSMNSPATGAAFDKAALPRTSSQSPVNHWDILFKDDTWLRAIKEIKYEDKQIIDGTEINCTVAPPPIPTLIGNLESPSPSDLLLLISDCGGDAFCKRNQFFSSLRDQDFKSRQRRRGQTHIFGSLI